MAHFDRDLSNNSSADEIDLLKIIQVLWQEKLIIITITFIGAVFSVILALSIPNTYKSNALLAPINQGESLSSKFSSVSAISSLAGISIPTEVGSKSQEAIARIRSLDFFTNQFLPYINLEDLMALQKWNPRDNTLVYDTDKFDPILKKWVRKPNYPYKIIPSNQEAYEVYQQILSISEDRKTKFITISTHSYSPYIAKDWLDVIVNNINESMRLEDIELASSHIKFLNEQYLETNLTPIKESISKILETKIQKLMLASADKNYIFNILEKPVVPDFKYSPSRAIICILITFISGLFSLLIVIARHFYFIKRNDWKSN